VTWIFVAAAVLGVIVVALVAVGGEVFNLSRQPRQALFDVDEAVDHVADRLPAEMTARLSYDDVRALLRWHLAYLRDEGVPEDRSVIPAVPVVVADDESLARLLARADDTGLDVTDDEVWAVLDAELDYFRAIGAIGPEILPGPEGAP